MADDSQEVSDILDGLTTPSPIEVYEAVREYDTRPVVAAVGSKAHGAGGGGSQPGAVRVLDLGLVSIPDLLVSGPVTLYAPEDGDFVDLRVVNYDTDFVAPNGGLKVVYGLIKAPRTLSNDTPDSRTGDLIHKGLIVNLGDAHQQMGTNTVANGGPPGSLYEIGLASDFANPQVLPPVGVWQANHAYNEGDAILVAGFVQLVSTAGTSGGSAPSFDATPGGTTPDGPDTLEWTNGGAVPTVGAIHFNVLVATPAAP